MKGWPARVFAGMAILLSLCSVPASAQANYPDRPIEIIVPFAPGGSVDVTFRVLAPLLGKELGQSVVVINRPGAAGTIGINQVAKAAPDGYTLGAASFTFAADPALLKNVPYDPLTDFEPITIVAHAPLMVLVNPKTPVTTLQGLIDWVKSKPPGSLNYGSVGIGSSGQLFTALFLSRAGLVMKHVPFTNGGREPLAQGLIQLQLGPIAADLPWVRDGRLRALAVTSLEPVPNLPDLPPVSRTLPNYEAFEWPGLVAPKGVPRPIIERVRQAVLHVLHDPDLTKKFTALGEQPIGDTPEDFRSFVADQEKTWKTVVAQIGLKPQ